MPCKHELDQGPRYIRWTCIFEKNYVHPLVDPAFADVRQSTRYKHMKDKQCTGDKRPYCYEEA